MFKELIKWDIYAIITVSTPITGGMFRGRVRTRCSEKNRNVLVEKTHDDEKVMRFAIPAGEDPAEIRGNLIKIIPAF